MDSILECSKRTVTKIAIRMKLSCFNCGWDKARCDLHHIVPQSKGGTDSPSNLTYICPNCHRLAHTGKLMVFRTFEEVIGDEWKNFYNVTPVKKTKRLFTGKIFSSREDVLQNARQKRTEKAVAKAKAVLDDFVKAEIDLTVYGWKEKASKVLNVSPQKVTWYLQKYAPHLLEDALTRNKTTIRLTKI